MIRPSSLQLLKRIVPPLAAALIAISMAACGAAGPPQQQARIDAHVGRYVHHRSADEVVAATRRVLEDRGYKVLPILRGEAVQTEWKVSIGSREVAMVQERYYVIVHPLTKEHSRVMAVLLQRATMGMETWHPLRPFVKDGREGGTVNSASYGTGLNPLPMGKPVVRRALEVEWEIIRRLDPDRARQIESMAGSAAAAGPSAR